MDDELSKRREAAEAAPLSPAKGRQGSSGQNEQRDKIPPLWRWFSAQVAHSDLACAAAAKSVRERWDLATRRFSQIDRSLAGEDSEHLVPFRRLLDEYRLTFAIADDDNDFARETGMAGLLVPFGPEKCEDCTRDAVPGTGKCGRHGGQWISPQDAADISHQIHDRLLASSLSALRVLQDLMDNGRSEQVRMMAATSILDRAGVGPHMNINHSGEITVTDQEKAETELRVRLERLAANTVEKQRMAAELMASSTVDAEVIEEPEAVQV